MQFKHILVPYDKSETATRALDEAIALASCSDVATIDVLYVVSMPDIVSPLTYSTASTSAEMYSSDPILVNVDEAIKKRRASIANEQGQLFEDLKPRFANVVDRVTLTIQPGITPVDDIVEFANSHGNDLIVMGCRGLGAIRGMLGSVSYGVLRASTCPVLIVK